MAKRSRDEIKARMFDLFKKKARIEAVLELEKRNLIRLDQEEAQERAVVISWKLFESVAGQSDRAWKTLKLHPNRPATTCQFADLCWYRAGGIQCARPELFTLSTLDGLQWTVCDMCLPLRRSILGHPKYGPKPTDEVRVDPAEYEPEHAETLRRGEGEEKWDPNDFLI
jgi:hypothetical protein